MQIKKHILACIALGVAFTGCELPKSPDFRTSHKVEAPVMYNKTFQFMGDSTMSVMIDTTGSDFDSLFTIDGDDFITISKEQDFNFGELNDAIPVIDVDPTSFDAAVGEIEITDFSSGSGDLGSANIEEVTGQNPNFVPAGTPIPAGSNAASPVRIGIGANTDFFSSATIKSGALDVQLTNNLGFDFQTATIQVIDTTNNAPIGNAATFSAGNGNQLTDGTTQTASITFSDGDQLRNLGVEIVVSWDNFNFPNNPQELVVNSVNGNNLVASQVQAALDEQDFSTSSTASFSADEFEFTQPSHFIRMKAGEIDIAPIQNDLDFSIDVTINFADIQNCPASVATNIPEITSVDPLVISYTQANGTEISRSGSSNQVIVPLAECEVYATNNEVTFTIDAATENTKNAPQGDQIRVINETQSVAASVNISGLEIERATGIIKQQTVLLNDDDPADFDDDLALFNDNEAEITEIDGLNDLSSQLSDINFTNPILSINYETNISVPTTIYGAFVGINGDGEQVYLRGTGTDYSVDQTDPISGLLKDAGDPLSADEMIKFSLADNLNGDNINASIQFDRTNTNVDDFLNNLPSEIRFIGKAVVNEDENTATIIDPLNFDPKISVDIPLRLSTTQPITYTDTVEQDMSGVPSPENGDDQSITEGIIAIDYENGFPMGVDLVVTFLDSLQNELSPVSVQLDEITLQAAQIGADRFADHDNPTSGTIEIALSGDQLDQLYKTRFLEVSASLQTTNNQDVKIRTTDFITLSVRAELTIESEVN
ncbi:hypothetical protein [Gracilimonas sp. BCB1]|uniref:hypothetical protein n=1 Tax=Gracilimonas sp. BCB1 TaxID=3152362 RepID=UPI0032D968BE